MRIISPSTGRPHESVLPLYIIEPGLIHTPDFDALHWRFIRQSLIELQDRLADLGQPPIRYGDAQDVFERLLKNTHSPISTPMKKPVMPQTFSRDQRLQDWSREKGIMACIPNMVSLGLKDRDGWSRQWEERMRGPIFPTQPLYQH